MRLVYVLCTASEDYLYLLAANAMLSRLSAPGCPVLCLTDRETQAAAARLKFKWAQWVDELLVLPAAGGSPILNSRELKTSMRSHVSGDFLFLDIDAVLVSSELMRSLQGPCLCAAHNLDHARLKPGFPEEVGRQIYGPLQWEWPITPYVNSGVLFCRDTPSAHRVFSRWHELWREQHLRLGVHLDQPALNRALFEQPDALTLMPGNFNAPVDVGPAFERDAWVYHYFLSLYSGKPRLGSLLGIVKRELQRGRKVSGGFLRGLLQQRRAFIPDIYDVQFALEQGWWRHAFNLWRDSRPQKRSAAHCRRA